MNIKQAVAANDVASPAIDDRRIFRLGQQGSAPYEAPVPKLLRRRFIVNDPALSCVGEVVNAKSDKLIPDLLARRLGQFEKMHDVAGCRQTSDTWENRRRPNAMDLHIAAHMRAVREA